MKTNKLYILIYTLILIIISLVIGCSETSELTPDILIQNTDQYVGSRVEVSGIVDHVCHQSGKRMFIKETESSAERFKIVTTAKIEKFEIELEGKTVKVAGLINEQKVDKAFLDNWEKEIIGEKPEIGHQGHDHDKAEVDSHHEPALEQINALRKQLAESDKDYLSFYSLACTSFEIIK